MSSAKSLGFHDSSFDKSLTYIKNNKGPTIEPCGTPASDMLRKHLLLPNYHKKTCKFYG